MSSKMNFGPEWMRSAPNSKRNAPVNGTSAASDGGTAAPGEKPTDLLSDTNALLLTANDADAPVYSHEKMLELFKVQSVADDFIINDCVFSQKALPPVCMTELSAKEQELLAGPVNSTSSRRYNGGQHAPAHQHPRSNNASQRPNGHGSFSGTRARLRDADRSAAYQNFDTGTNGDYAGGIGMLSDALDTDREADSLWADQMIGRESIGSFGADGVFRMSGVGDDTGLLERPPPHSSIKGDIGPSAYSSRAASPSAAGSRAAALKSPQSHQHPGSSGDSYAWNELASMPISPAQQRLLADRAERLKWWYRDPQGNTQGPFSTAHMQEWCSGGYFPSNLQVCHEGGPGFESLNAMIDRIGQPQDIFVYSAMIFLAQKAASSGLSTPATPGALSRVGSSAQLPPALGDPPNSTIAQPAQDQHAPGSSQLLLSSGASPAPVGGGRSAASTNSPANDPSKAGLSYSVTNNFAASSTSGESLQTAQLLALLKEQLLIVTAIGERQHLIMALQEQQQQALAKLMRELAQETNSVHYKAQMEQVPVQSDVLYALQQHAQAAEERLRLEYAQILQMHAAHIAQLETKVDPVIKDILLHNGSAFALNFIGQRLEELNAQIVSSSLANGAVPASAGVSAPAAEASVSSEPLTEAHSKPAADVDSAAEKLEKLEVADKKPRRKDAGKGKKAAAKPFQPSGDTAATSDTPESSVHSDKLPKSDASAISPVSNPAPWSTPANTTNKHPKKSLLQIQQEEEAAMQKRREAEEKQRLTTGVSSIARSGASYADSVNNNSGAAPQSLAAIMEEQYKESASPNTASSFTLMASKSASQARSSQPANPPKDSAWSGRSVTASAVANKATPAAKPQSSKTKPKSSNEPLLPSLEFLQWCHTRLGSLRGVDPSKFIEMLLTFPLQAPESTLEIISEQIYAYSTTLNGRAFAEDFAKRRLKDHNAVKNGSAKSAPANWSQLLKSQKKASAYSSVASAHSAGSRNTNADSSFQVVSKKGRK